MSNKTIQEFYVLPLKFSTSSSSHHELFIKEHVVRHQSAETPAGCTLFVLNVPPYATEDSLKRVFSVAGAVNRVIIKKQPNIDDSNIHGFKVAYVVFTKSHSVKKLLKSTSGLNPLSTPEKPVICGIQKWVTEYNQSIPDPKVLQHEINQFMSAYDKQTDDERKKQEQMTGEQDEDGWITVTKHGRNPGLSRKEIVEQRIKAKIEKNAKRKELRNFYTFQIRDSKMRHLANLRQKFEEDKKKINALKVARKFKPF